MSTDEARVVATFDGVMPARATITLRAAYEQAVRELAEPARDEDPAWSRLARCNAAALAFGRNLAARVLSEDVGAGLRAALATGAPTTLVVRVNGPTEAADAMLDLPWELISPDDTELPVRAGVLNVVREVAVESMVTERPPPDVLTVGVSVAAPHGDDRQLRHEDEVSAIYDAVVPHGHRVIVSDLGTLADVAAIANDHAPTIHHHVSHGVPGALELEDDEGFPRLVSAAEIVETLTRGGAPRVELFFAGTCAGASAGGRGTAGAITASALHRAGIPQVVAFHGLIADVAAIAAARAFYRGIAAGERVTTAVRAARAAIVAVAESSGDMRLAFAWAQLTIYQRGRDVPLASPRPVVPAASLPPRQERLIDGLPILERGFIGRRQTRHELRAKLRGGQRVIVILGPSGGGKTALAAHLLGTELWRANDPLVLLARGLGPADAAEAFRRRAEAYGDAQDVPEWPTIVAQTRIVEPDPARGLERLVEVLAARFPDLVIYADNLETLLAPSADAALALHPHAAPVWQALRRLSARIPLLATTRHAWPELAPDELYALPPMSRLDLSRLYDSFPQLRRLPEPYRQAILMDVAGTPRVVELVAAAIDPERPTTDPISQPLLRDIKKHVTQRQLDDLGFEAVWERLDSSAREHATLIAALQAGAPIEVIDALGNQRDALRRASLLLRDSVAGVTPDRRRAWTDRWMIDARARATLPLGGTLTEEQHRAIGRAYLTFISSEPGTTGDFDETVHHLHLAREAGLAWPTARQIATWMRDRGMRTGALSLLEESVAAGLSGEALALNEALQQQLRVGLGMPAPDPSSDLADGTTAFARGAAAVHRGDFVTARKEADLALQRALATPDINPLDLAASHYAVAKLMLLVSDLAGIDAQRRAIAAIGRGTPGGAHPATDGLLLSIDIDRRMLVDDHAGAIPLQRRLIAHYIRAHETEQHLAVAEARLNLAQMMELQLRREKRRGKRRELAREATKLASAALRFYKKQPGDYSFEQHIAAALVESLER